ncbi:hypothetical protein F610DRAFT_06964 [Streptomyces sp. LaPpAH-199]|nr:hypothetical protein F610DRAFT_06964 [Streptomyces sp. LaPpAH-199]
MIALVGGGGALLGAAVGGTAAVVAAKVQAQHGQEVAHLAYQGPIEAARRTAQQASYRALLTAADQFSRAADLAVEPARALLSLTDSEARNEEPEEAVPEKARVKMRTVLAEVSGPDAVRSAARHVYLEGPIDVSNAASAVVAAVKELSDVFVHAETKYESEDEDGRPYFHGLGKNPRMLHIKLVSTINDFSREAGAHLNAVKAQPAKPARRRSRAAP